MSWSDADIHQLLRLVKQSGWAVAIPKMKGEDMPGPGEDVPGMIIGESWYVDWVMNHIGDDEVPKADHKQRD